MSLFCAGPYAALSTFGTEGGKFSDAEETDGAGAAQSMGEVDDLAGAASGRAQARRSPGKWSRQSVAAFSAQFMHPEWLVDVPADLASAWYVTPRPSGQRCLVIASRGATVRRCRLTPV